MILEIGGVAAYLETSHFQPKMTNHSTPCYTGTHTGTHMGGGGGGGGGGVNIVAKSSLLCIIKCM